MIPALSNPILNELLFYWVGSVVGFIKSRLIKEDGACSI